jgi:hypothetical protein
MPFMTSSNYLPSGLLFMKFDEELTRRSLWEGGRSSRI